MKKIIVKILTQPWVYIICGNFLLFWGFRFSDNPGWLYSSLPEPWYDAWEVFAVSHLERCLFGAGLLLFIITGIWLLGMLFYLKTNKFKKIKMVVLYVLLIFISWGIFIPRLGHAKYKTKLIRCSANLKLIYQAFKQYAGDNDNNLPPNLKALSDMNYLIDQRFYKCPSRIRSNTEFSDYLYYGAGHKFNESPIFVIIVDRDKNHLGRYSNQLMSDGSILSVEADNTDN
jgi:competence protein ComGC